jgi:hypothetical protein
MSYNIIKSDGTPLATVADGQTNSTASSLTLIGKNYAGYGTFLNENFVKLLENFAGTSAPLYPLVGQLWWKTDTRLLQVYDRFGNWKTISGAQSQSDAPTNAIAGDLWFDTVNQQLKVYSGASWIVIGPSFTATTGTSGAIADTVIGSDLLPHVVVKFFVQNQLIAILSKDDTFTPGTTIPGFSTIRPGFNLARDRVPALVYYDNANNASYLGGVLANRYVLKTAPTLEAKLVIQNVDGLEIQEAGGTVSYFEMNQGGNNINFIGKQRGQGFIFKMIPDSGGLQINALTIDRVTGLVSVSAPTPGAGSALLVATKGYVDAADVALSGQITSAVNSLNDTIDTLTANTTVVYGNVRVIQSTLGIGGPPGANTTPWNQLTVGSGQTIAANIMTLWSNVAAIHANVLSNPGTAPASTASMYSNVRLLQNDVSSIGTRALLRNGDSTWTGVQKPDADNTYDVGTSLLRFKDLYSYSINLRSIAHSGTSGTGDIGAATERFGTLYCTSINSSGSLTIPVGDTAGRPNPPATGMIRYNTTNSAFEGYAAASWQSLGGVKSVDGYTYIIAETSAGASNGELDFYVEAAGGTSGTKAAGLNKDRLLITAGTKLQTNYITTGADATTGSIQGLWTLVGTSRMQATYSDLAERFAADAHYPEGTVVTLGGTHEVTQENADLSENVFGIVSHKYAYLMNQGAGDDITHPPIALVGRVPVRVIGTVTKGQRLVSAGNGCARVAVDGELSPFNVVGRSLEDKTDPAEALTLCVVKIN